MPMLRDSQYLAMVSGGTQRLVMVTQVTGWYGVGNLKAPAPLATAGGMAEHWRFDMTEHTGRIDADEYFTMIPEWVLYGDISAYAVRLYGTLRRHADQRGVCFPSRRRLAALCQMSESTLDRSMKELVQIGALRMERRQTDDGNYTSNRYTVVSQRGGGVSQNPGGVISDARGGVQNEVLTRAIVNESHEPEQMLTVPVSEKAAADGFDEFWGLYPRKVGKEKAHRVWAKLSKSVRADALWALPRHIELWERKQVAREFIPYPTSWLNGRRWEDDLSGELQQPVQPSRSAPGMGVIRAIMQGKGELG
jgi:hypothetical protein